MARSIAKIRETQSSAEAVKEAQIAKIESLFVEYTQDIEQMMRLLRLLREKGILDAGAAVLEQGHDLLEILVHQANHPGSIGGIKNIIAVVQGMTKIDAKLVAAVFNGVSDASRVISSGDADDIGDLWDIVRVLRDRDVNQGLTAVFAVLKSVGQHVDGSSSTRTSGPAGEGLEQNRNPVAT
ncbi:DUF1641 domain-containing protein [Alicyclobacillus sp. SO9]|uniref:DUF1641 domain-containing protein n=1 Tax=Alicyclobacillus sp. SO9 TaxID=2665646 RepID=UPI0018E7EB2C|nr:DUF1641 domain-containing protein [Alicyclobacillus sp. SO9]QQE76865.1 DUF1641 domain-containing protein [Alicyclobacillus sp. SO9]